MKLDDWLKVEKTTSAAFARLSGIGDRQLVHKYRHGERFPTPENLRRIREATNGAVTADDFVDQHAGASPPHLLSESAVRSGATTRRRKPAAPRPEPSESVTEAAD